MPPLDGTDESEEKFGLVDTEWEPEGTRSAKDMAGGGESSQDYEGTGGGGFNSAEGTIVQGTGESGYKGQAEGQIYEGTAEKGMGEPDTKGGGFGDMFGGWGEPDSKVEQVEGTGESGYKGQAEGEIYQGAASKVGGDEETKSKVGEEEGGWFSKLFGSPDSKQAQGEEADFKQESGSTDSKADSKFDLWSPESKESQAEDGWAEEKHEGSAPFDESKEGIGLLGDMVGKGLDAARWVLGTGREAVRSTRDKALDAARWVFNTGRDAVRSTRDEVIDTAGDVAEAAWDFAEEQGDRVGDLIDPDRGETEEYEGYGPESKSAPGRGSDGYDQAEGEIYTGGGKEGEAGGGGYSTTSGGTGTQAETQSTSTASGSSPQVAESKSAAGGGGAGSMGALGAQIAQKYGVASKQAKPKPEQKVKKKPGATLKKKSGKAKDLGSGGSGQVGAAAAKLGAQAFTVGAGVAFGAADQKQGLLGHEAMHVVQQGSQANKEKQPEYLKYPHEKEKAKKKEKAKGKGKAKDKDKDRPKGKEKSKPKKEGKAVIVADPKKKLSVPLDTDVLAGLAEKIFSMIEQEADQKRDITGSD